MSLAPRSVCLIAAALVSRLALADLHMIQKVDAGGQIIESETWMSMKEKKIRMSMQNPMTGQMSTILDIGGGKVITVMAASKSYIEIPLATFKQKAQAAAGGKPPAIEKTGKTQTINGFSCVQYHMTHENGLDATIWVTKDLKMDYKEWAALSKEASGDIVSSSYDAAQIDGLPILIEGTIGMRGQKVTMKSEVLKADTGDVPAGTFDLPSGYQKMDMGAAGNPFAK
ncbi:MAG: DUF4412 domain-containing protein [Acidobacteriota bacterium]